MMALPESNFKKTLNGKNVISSALSRYSILASPSPPAFTNKYNQIQDELNFDKTAMVFADIFRATTTVNGAGAAECRGIHLCVKPRNGVYDLTPPFIQDNCQWIFGGEENGQAIPGGDIGNSPLAVNQIEFVDRFLKFYSTNGARALEAITKTRAGTVFLMSLANIEVTVDAILAQGFKHIWFVGGGFYGNATLEDNVATGRAIEILTRKTGFKLERDDEAVMMHKVADSYGDDDGQLIADLVNGQVAGVLNSVSRLEDIPACVNGTGMKELWREMRQTVIELEWFKDIPILKPKKMKK